MSHRTRWAVAACAAAIVGGAGASPAAAFPELDRRAEASLDTATGAKEVRAHCKAGWEVIGGGGFVDDHGRKHARLTGLMPRHDYGGSGDFFEARAETPYLGETFAWKLTAYAICVRTSAIDGYEIAWDFGEPARSSRFRTAAARCPAGKVAYGAGAGLVDANGRVGLQLNRTSGPLDISRATAREDGSYDDDWRLGSVAVCAYPEGGIHAEDLIDPGADATMTCASGRIHGPGGGGGLTDEGPGWLRKIYPSGDLRSVQVGLTAKIASGDMIVHSTCGS
ncbi:MAG TPA: hypothetical protein VNO82_01595 [Solirubrobacteraceae bacterium]|nr:hypothetical protein [Solirubrobacteraceae bacterium]